jgi:hypothetical protein
LQVAIVAQVPAFAITVMLSGSSSHMPPSPAGAPVSTDALAPMVSVWPEVSINPPLPPSAPPRALARPLNIVSPTDHTTIVPPLPRVMAFASKRAPASTVTARACGSGPVPW